MKINFKESDSITFFYQLFISLDSKSGLRTEEDFTNSTFYERDLITERNMTVYRANHIEDYFIYESERFLSTLSRTNTLIEFAAGKYRLMQKDGTVWFFCDPLSCKLTGIYTPDGKQLFFAYNKQKQLISIKNFHGFNISLSWNYGEICGITETIYPLEM